MSLLPLLRRVPPRAFARFASSSSVPAVKISGSDLTASQKAPGQSPNVPTPWSTNQNPKPNAWDTARAEQVDVSFQPDALSAMGLVREQPVAMLHSRTAVCDGGGGALGHPKIFINLDKEGPHTCGYCGARFQQEHEH